MARLLRTGSYNLNERKKIQQNEETRMRVVLRENIPKWSNIDGMNNMLKMSRRIPLYDMCDK